MPCIYNNTVRLSTVKAPIHKVKARLAVSNAAIVVGDDDGVRDVQYERVK